MNNYSNVFNYLPPIFLSSTGSGEQSEGVGTEVGRSRFTRRETGDEDHKSRSGEWFSKRSRELEIENKFYLCFSV